jgi:hypothetical protein
MFIGADFLEQKFDIRVSEQMNASLMAVRDEAKVRLLKSMDGGVGAFAFCLLIWRRQSNPGDKTFVEVIEKTISSL